MQQGRTISVQQGYELWAPTYASERNPLLALQERTLEPLIPSIAGLRVLDIGCGTGRWLRRLAARGPAELVGIDPSEAMLRNAKPPGTAHLACADACSVPLPDRWADLIFCSLALDHIEDLEAFAREVGRLAADDAQFVLSEFHPEAHHRGWKRSFRSGGETFEFAVSSRSLAEITDAFAPPGFELRHCSEPGFGEPDRTVFVELGRPDLYESARDAGAALFHLSFRMRRRRPTVAITKVAAPLRLANARAAMGPCDAASATLAIADDQISIETTGIAAPAADLSGYLLLPGLVNAHDHLEFALFPRLGNGIYTNAKRWADDIHRPEASPVREHRRVPQEVRLWWGGLRNLLSGVTTVHHHNPYDPLFDRDFPVRVAECGWAHSFAFEPEVSARHAATPGDAPFVIHLGEGVDDDSRAEFSRLQADCGLTRNTVLVHGVALQASDIAALNDSGAALIWCPSSNLFMLGATLRIEAVCSFQRIALATDSPISGAGDLFDEIAVARNLGISAERIYNMVTRGAADVLKQREGSIVGGGGDLIAIPDPGGTPAEALVAGTYASVELVIVGGRVRLISPALRARWPFALPPLLEKIVIEGVERYVDAPVRRLFASAQEHLGPVIRLGHKRVWQ